MARKFEVKSCGHTEIDIDLCELISVDDDQQITGVKIDNEVLIFISEQIKEKFHKPKKDEYCCKSCGFSWVMENKLKVSLLSCVLCGQDGCVVPASVKVNKTDR